LVFVGTLAVVSAAEVPIYPGYVNPSFYPTVYSPYSPSMVYSNQPVIQKVVPEESEIKDNKVNIEAVEKVFAFIGKFIGELKDNIPANAVPPVNIPTGAIPAGAIPTGAIPAGASVYTSAVPANYQPSDVKIEDVEAVFGLISKFISTLSNKEAPAAATPETATRTKRSPEEVKVVPTTYYNYAYKYNTLPLNYAYKYNTLPLNYASQPLTYANPIADPITYTASEPVVTENKPNIEDIEKVFALIGKFIGELKANIPTGAIPAGAVPTGAIPAGASVYTSAVPANYQPSDVKIEDVEAVFGLITKFIATLSNKEAPAAATPEPETRTKRSPEEIKIVPVNYYNNAYNTVPLNYAVQPLTFAYPIADPITYTESEPVAVTENKPNIEDIEKVFALIGKFIGELRANIPADAVNIPPVNIPSVTIPPAAIPAVSIPTGPISGGVISGF